MRQLVLVVDSGCFVASIYALDVRMAKPLLNGRFFTIVPPLLSEDDRLERGAGGHKRPQGPPDS